METWKTAEYLRLSREDGDKAESDSIANQHKQLEQYLTEHPELELVDYYVDDGYTGTSFEMCIRDRPYGVDPAVAIQMQATIDEYRQRLREVEKRSTLKEEALKMLYSPDQKGLSLIHI